MEKFRITVKISDVPDGNGNVYTKGCLQKIADRTSLQGLKVTKDFNDQDVLGKVKELKVEDDQLKVDVELDSRVAGKELYPCMQGEIVSKIKKDGVTHVKYFSMDSVSLCESSVDPGVNPIKL